MFLRLQFPLIRLLYFQEHERNKLSQLTRELGACRSDNERLSSTVADLTGKLAQEQDKFNAFQLQLGRKDAQLSAMLEER